MAINPYTNRIYTVNQDANRVSVIDGDNKNKVKNIILNYSTTEDVEPHLIVEAETEMVYVSNGADTIIIIDGKTDDVVTAFSTDNYLTNLAITPITIGFIC